LTHDINLTTQAYGGDAIGRLPNGKAVFVPYGLSGEKVSIRLVEEKRRFARGEIVELLERSDKRIKPRCKHFTECGGCHYQHIAYEDQMVRSPNEWNYRNNIQFHVNPKGNLGFQAPRSNKIIDIDECHLPETTIIDAWRQLDVDMIPGLERINLRSGVDGDLMVILESSDPPLIDFELDLPISLIHKAPEGSIVLAGEDYIRAEISGQEFIVSSDSFFQVNIPIAKAMVEHILEYLNLTDDLDFVDAFCGVGLFSVFIAPLVKKVTAVEINPASGEDFVNNLDNFENVALFEARVDDVLEEANLQPDIILFDPPRSGLGARILNALANIKPRTVVYISCNPSTLARDAKKMVECGYSLESITGFDMFPQTFHIESISFWHLEANRDD
jgi:23S rRNA (uracil1939-C5)-methyltransferase